MQYKRQTKTDGGSISIIIPADLARYMELEPGNNVIIQDDTGKHGKFISIWKEKEE